MNTEVGVSGWRGRCSCGWRGAWRQRAGGGHADPADRAAADVASHVRGRGRPRKPEGEAGSTITAYVPGRLLAALDARCEETGQGRSDLICAAIEALLGVAPRQLPAPTIDVSESRTVAEISADMQRIADRVLGGKKPRRG